MTEGSSTYHAPVLGGELVAAADGARRVVDATLGGGGHAALFRQGGAEVLGIDRDPDALAATRKRLGETGMRYLQTSYASDEALEAIRQFGPAFILLDLGVSSHQLDRDARGFSFRPGAPLDMRMSQSGPTAADLLNRAPESELRQILADYGDEPRAARMAREIVRRRGNETFATSDHLVNAIRAVRGPQSGPGDFARLFQAVRIALNGELSALTKALPEMRDALPTGGRLAVISYHSGEDRIVKHMFQDLGPPVRLSARGTPVHMPRPTAGTDRAPESDSAWGYRDLHQPEGPECHAPHLPQNRGLEDATG